MRFKAKKVYGSSKQIICPFCARIATQKNEQGVEVCHVHAKSVLPEIRCLCGSWLEQRSGKFGPYFHCMKCGSMNFARGMEIKQLRGDVKPSSVQKEEQQEKKESYERKETIITTDDVEYFD